MVELTESRDSSLKNEVFFLFYNLFRQFNIHKCVEESKLVLSYKNKRTDRFLLEICVYFLESNSRQHQTELYVLKLLKYAFMVNNNICETFDQMGGVDILLDMQMSENNKIFEVVAKLLETFFDCELEN